MLRVMLVNGGLQGGGAEHVIATLARQLRSAGHAVSIAVINAGGEVQHELENEGFDVIGGIGRHARLGQTHRRLAALATERAVDVLHSHDLRSLVDVALCRLRSRTFAHVHTFHFGNYPHVSGKHLLMESLFARVPDRLVAVGNAQRESIVRALRISPRRIVTVWNGVDAPPTDGLRPTAEPVRPLLGSMSTLGPQKGLPTLLDALAMLKARGLRFRFQIVGEGDLRTELEAQVSRLGLGDSVEFTGWVADAATSLLPAFDIFVQSSYWEAMSVVILEAMARGRAIVATSVGENPSVLAHGRTALLVPPKDPVALAEAMATLISNPSRRAELGNAARAEYLSRLTGAAMAGRYAALYRDCLRSKGRSIPAGAQAVGPTPRGHRS